MRNVLLILSICSVLIGTFACRNVNKGRFEYINGKEIYVEDNQQVFDRLVEVDGEEYYIGSTGSKSINTWKIIDNDGNYGYFGHTGKLVKNQIREIGINLYLFNKEGILETNGLKTYKKDKYYALNDGVLIKNQIKLVDTTPMYFDENGKYKKSAGCVHNVKGDYPEGYYYFDKAGNLLKSAWKDGCYFGEDGKMATKQWIGNVYVGEDGKIVSSEKNDNYNTTDVYSILSSDKNSDNNKHSTSITESVKQRSIFEILSDDSSNIDITGEKKTGIYISGHSRKTFTTEFNWKSNNAINEVKKCEIVFDVPIIGGDSDEISTYNRQISNLVDQYFNTLRDWSVLCREHKLDGIEAAAFSLQFLSTQQNMTESNGKVLIYLNAIEMYSTGVDKYLTMDLKNAHKFIIDRVNKVVQFNVNTKNYPYGGYELEMNYIEK